MSRKARITLIIVSSFVALLVVINLSIIMLLSVKKSRDARYYYNVKWVCENPKIEIRVPAKEEFDENGHVFGAMLEIDGEKKSCIGYWGQGNLKRMSIKGKDSDLFGGSYTLSSDTKTLTLKITYDYIFDNAYETLTFTRMDLED